MLPVNLISQAAGDFSPAYIALARETEQVLVTRDGEKPTAPDLIYKMLVCLIAIENPADDYTTEISGEVRTFNDLIKLSLLADNTEATQKLAEYIDAGSGALVSKLSSKLVEMELTGTFFTDDIITTKTNSHTTPKDITRFVIQAIQNQEFNTLFCSQVVLASDSTLISNTNKLVLSAGNARIVGGATSTFIDENGEEITQMCYLGNVTAKKDDSTFDTVLAVQSDSTYGYENIGENILENLTENFRCLNAVSKDEVLLTVSVGNENLDIIAVEDAPCVISNDIDNPVLQISYRLTGGEDIADLEPPVKKGTVLGSANITLADNSIVSVPIAANQDIYVGSSWLNNLITALASNTSLIIILSVLIALEIMMIVLKLHKKRNTK